MLVGRKLISYDDIKLLWSWGRRLMAVVEEVTWHGRAHPYSRLITIVSLRSKERVRNEPQKWVETKLLRHVPCRYVSACVRRMPVPFLLGIKSTWGLGEVRWTFSQYSAISDTPIPRERSDTNSKSTPNPADTPSAWAYSFSPLKVVWVTWVSQMIL
jgi:hypothetical protein